MLRVTQEMQTISDALDHIMPEGEPYVVMYRLEGLIYILSNTSPEDVPELLLEALERLQAAPAPMAFMPAKKPQ